MAQRKFLSKNELIWEAMWAFAYLCILASLFWYYKLIHVLNKNSAGYYSRLLEMSDYATKYESNNSVEAKDELLKEDPLNTEKIKISNWLRIVSMKYR